MLGFGVLGTVFAMTRAAFVIQVENREPTTISILIQIAAGGLLGVALGIFLVRFLSVRSRATRNLIFASCLVTSVPALAYVVSWLSLNPP